MVMRPGSYQANANGGELAPEVWGNTGLKQFFSGLARAENIQPVPQGGFRLMPRTRFAADLGTVLGAVKLIAFTVSRADSYMVVLTAGATRIFKAGVPVATLAMPWTSDQIAQVKAIQRRETMVLFHPDHPPWRILRQGADDRWTAEAITWSNVPQVDYGGTYENTDEQWAVRIQWIADTNPIGEGFTLSVDGESTTMILFSGDVAANMASALKALAALDSGIKVAVYRISTFWQEYIVTFSGGRNSGQNFTLSGYMVTVTTAAVTTARLRKGKMGGEAVMSAARGWPRCAAWYQDRLIMAGFSSKPSAWLASRTAEYFDLNVDLVSDAGAMLINLDADGGETILHMVQSVFLGIFTSNGEYHLSDRALKRNAPPNIVRSSTNGCSARVAPIPQESSILYVSREETVVYAATYDAVSTTFQSTPLSILSSHLIEGIGSADLQVSHAATDAQRLWLVRDDGMMVVACLLRNQDVQPFVRWTTDGAVRDVCVDGANRPHLLVDRRVGGAVHRVLEILDDDLLFDAAVTRSFDTAVHVIDGLGIHDGAEVWAEADGFMEGPFTVVGGAITLATAARTVTVGRWQPPVATTLPLPRDVDGRQVLKRPCRVHTVQIDVIDTTSIALAANGQPVRDIPLARAGDPVDVPTPAFTGEIVRTGLPGFTGTGQVTVTQTRPGRLQVRDWTLQART